MENHTSQEAYDTIGKYRCFPPFNSPANHNHQIKSGFLFDVLFGPETCQVLTNFWLFFTSGECYISVFIIKSPEILTPRFPFSSGAITERPLMHKKTYLDLPTARSK